MPEIFIENALSPAVVMDVSIDEYEKTARVIVPENQLSLAIGKEGQNALRHIAPIYYINLLASKLIYDCINTTSVHTYTSTYRIYIRINGTYGNLCTRSGDQQNILSCMS